MTFAFESRGPCVAGETKHVAARIVFQRHLHFDLLANHFFQQARRFAHHLFQVHVFRVEDLPGAHIDP
jgi:hypothetical protein